METNIDFRKIWNKQNIETPEVEILYNKAKKLKSRRLLNLIAVNITLILTTTYIGFIWYYSQPDLASTKIGIILIISSMIIFALPYNKQFRLLAKNKTEPNSKEYLQKLTKLKEKEKFQQTTMLSAYFLILSLGIGLYLFEYVSKMTITWGIICYAFTILSIAINWFYLRPKVITKRNTKLNKLIVEFEKINDQMIS